LDIGGKLSLLLQDKLHGSLNFFVGHYALQNVRLKLLERMLQNLRVETKLADAQRQQLTGRGDYIQPGYPCSGPTICWRTLGAGNRVRPYYASDVAVVQRRSVPGAVPYLASLSLLAHTRERGRVLGPLLKGSEQ
jgi:hypothetical protein